MHQPNLAQSPDELFDVLNEDGSPTGVTKRRADVHRDGDWHRAIHVWVHGVDADGPFLLFNLRSQQKDTMPGRLDVTVGGHLGAGETVADAFREIEEEIGIVVQVEIVEFLHVRKAHGDTERELQDVFLLRDDRPLTSYRPNPAELAGLVRIPLAAMRALLKHDVDSVDASMLNARSGQVEPVTVDTRVLLPSRHLGYHLAIVETVTARLSEASTPGA